MEGGEKIVLGDYRVKGKGEGDWRAEGVYGEGLREGRMESSGKFINIDIDNNSFLMVSGF